ncbi:MAG TPA: type II toxin-antitoxin system RelE/ParE family toxin [Acidobacteriaceae bacterium]
MAVNDNLCVIIEVKMISLQEYLDAAGRNPYRAWFDGLDVPAATKVAVALERILLGNTSSFKAVGEGVSECKIDFGPGYRIYFGKDGDRLVILLGGGTKKRQSSDITDAQKAWREYKARKKVAQKEAAAKVLATLKEKQKTKRR